MSAATSSAQWSGIKVIELATEADYQWVGKFGGDSQAANNYIISVLNGVDVIYRRDLKLTIQVTFQHAWSYPDPYSAVNIVTTLTNFMDYWNANFPASNPTYRRDLAHLFTGKYNNTGYSYQSVVCINPQYGYGSSGYAGGNQYLQTIVAAHEIGHNLGAQHVADSGDCARTIMNPFASPLTNSLFCPSSITEITNFITNNINGGYDCLALEVPPPTPPRTLYDFDGDGKADISLFRPSNTVWYIQGSNIGFYTYPFGLATDKLAPADYDNDGKTDYGVFRDGYWYWINSSNGSFNAVQFGASGDIPVPGDFTGDKRAELVVFRPSSGNWYTFDLTNNQVGVIQFGQNGDKPVMGDFDGDGKNDYAVFRAGTWYIQRSTQGFLAVSFGDPTDLPVPADYDGDHKTDIAVFRPSNGTWYLQKSTEGFAAVQFGAAGDKPTPADYDGDGRGDISVYRPTDGTGHGVWYRINSSNNSVVIIGLGLSEDIPVPGFNVVP